MMMMMMMPCIMRWSGREPPPRACEVARLHVVRWNRDIALFAGDPITPVQYA